MSDRDTDLFITLKLAEAPREMLLENAALCTSVPERYFPFDELITSPPHVVCVSPEDEENRLLSPLVLHRELSDEHSDALGLRSVLLALLFCTSRWRESRKVFGRWKCDESMLKVCGLS